MPFVYASRSPQPATVCGMVTKAEFEHLID